MDPADPQGNARVTADRDDQWCRGALPCACRPRARHSVPALGSSGEDRHRAAGSAAPPHRGLALL